jgi:hypothetical protein
MLKGPFINFRNIPHPVAEYNEPWRAQYSTSRSSRSLPLTPYGKNTVPTHSHAHVRCLTACSAISVVTFPPGFLFLLIHGIVSENVHPAIGIVPLCFSAVFSLFLLANEKQCGCQRSGLSGTPVHLVFDVLLGVGHLTCLILTWIFLGQSRYDECVMFGTYCTWFLITDL